jgi:hypothetical protein
MPEAHGKVTIIADGPRAAPAPNRIKRTWDVKRSRFVCETVLDVQKNRMEALIRRAASV